MRLLASPFTAIQTIRIKTPTLFPAHPGAAAHCTLVPKAKLKLKTSFEAPPFNQLSERRCWYLGGTSQFQGRVKGCCAGSQSSLAAPGSLNSPRRWMLLLMKRSRWGQCSKAAALSVSTPATTRSSNPCFQFPHSNYDGLEEDSKHSPFFRKALEVINGHPCFQKTVNLGKSH